MRTSQRHLYSLITGLLLTIASHTALANDKAGWPLPALLDRHIAPTANREIEARGIPGVAIAVVNDQGILWSRHFGHSDVAATQPLTNDNSFRIGSITKLFTAIMVMQQVEAGRIELDAPVTTYLPDFQPNNPFGKPVTVRQLLQHTSGLVRESPAGHYFDNTGPSLKTVMQSLNGTTLVTEPGIVERYSNAGYNTLGYLLEQLLDKPYTTLIKEQMFEPLSMDNSRIRYSRFVRKHLAQGVMTPMNEPRQPAPVFDLASAPAGGIFAPLNDLATFASALLRDNNTDDGSHLMLKKDTLQAMWQPTEKFPNRGLGFAMTQTAGHSGVGHGGTIYGFGSELEVLPEQNLGVVVISTHDIGNSFAGRLAKHTLATVLANLDQQPLPEFPASRIADYSTAQAITGYYATDDGAYDLEITATDGTLTFSGLGLIAELRQLGNHWALDDAQIFLDGIQINADEKTVSFGPLLFKKQPKPQATEGTPALQELAGLYGTDRSNSVFVFEKNSQLHITFLNLLSQPLQPLEEADKFAFGPGSQMFPMQTIQFVRDEDGKATHFSIDGVILKRLPVN